MAVASSSILRFNQGWCLPAEPSQKRGFNLTSLPSRAYNAEEHEFDREFKFVIKDILDKFNSGNSGDPQQVIQGQLHSVESIMHQNIAKTLKRGAQLEDIVAQTEALENQARGLKKHLKRLNAPKSWLLSKLGGVYAPRPSAGPHKLRESLPMMLILRNKLKYALTGSEVTKIVNQRLIKVDGKVRTDATFPTGFMDVISIEKTGEFFRIHYDVKGRFLLHRISAEEAEYKLCRVKKVCQGPKKIPYLVLHDGRTIRYPDPLIKANDTVKIDIASGKVDDFIKFDSGNVCMVTGGRNLGRVGVITSRERHPGSFDIVHIKDSNGHAFATRLSYIFVIGKGSKPWVTLPKGKGVKLSIAEERDKRLAGKRAH